MLDVTRFQTHTDPLPTSHIASLRKINRLFAIYIGRPPYVGHPHACDGMLGHPTHEDDFANKWTSQTYIIEKLKIKVPTSVQCKSMFPTAEIP